MQPNIIRVAAVQMDVMLGKVDHNLEQINARAAAAAGDGADLVVFPEAAITGYCFDSLEEAWQFSEPIPGPCTARLQQLCRTHDLTVVVGMLERCGDQVFNASVAVNAAGLVGRYRKVHLPYLGVDQFISPGNLPFQVHATGQTQDAARVGMLICYDASFPEAARVLALDGADVIALPTNWPPGAEPTAAHVINARASENKVYVVAANRIGRERGVQFIGHSKICDVHGNTLAVAEHQNEAILYADVDLAEARTKRIERIPGKHAIDRFADRRPAFYGKILNSQDVAAKSKDQ